MKKGVMCSIFAPLRPFVVGCLRAVLDLIESSHAATILADEYLRLRGYQ